MAHGDPRGPASRDPSARSITLAFLILQDSLVHVKKLLIYAKIRQTRRVSTSEFRRSPSKILKSLPHRLNPLVLCSGCWIQLSHGARHG